MKIVLFILFHSLTFSTFGQYVKIIDCDNVGEPQWPKYQQYLVDVKNGKTYAKIREHDDNIWSILGRTKSSEYVLDKLYLRWILEDESILYKGKFSDIMDKEMFEVSIPSCAISVKPDAILEKYGREEILVQIERKDRGNFNIGIAFFLVPMKPDSRSEILNEIDQCENLDCKIEKLASRGLNLDALSLIEEAILQGSSNIESLRKKYWDLITRLNE